VRNTTFSIRGKKMAFARRRTGKDRG